MLCGRHDAVGPGGRQVGDDYPKGSSSIRQATPRNPRELTCHAKKDGIELTGDGHDVIGRSSGTLAISLQHPMDRSEIVTGTPASEAARDMHKDSNSRRAAACLVCRRSKIKCEKGRVQNDDRCQRCLQLGVQCVRPDFHVGRRKGVKKSVFPPRTPPAGVAYC